MSIAIFLAGAGVLLALIMMCVNYRKGVKMQPGNPTMREIAQAIREGADTFLHQEYKVSIPIIAIIAVLFSLIFHPYAGLAFVIGAAMSAFSGIVGMKAATIYNERVANTARLGVENGNPREKIENDAGNVALRGGSVMGFAVEGFALLGLLVVWLVVGTALMFSQPENLVPINSILPFVPIKFVMFIQVLTSYTLGCSVIAVFNRTGGGIYTKSADMGADLVGKTELNLPEDDPKNPAVIADCVGDNVGDVAGNGSDMLESATGAIVSTVVLAAALYTGAITAGKDFGLDLLAALMQFPLAYAGLGLLACIVGIGIILFRKKPKSVSHNLRLALFFPAGIIAVGAAVLSYIYFGNISLTGIDFKLGWWSPFISSVIGIVTGVILGLLSEYYTSESYKPTKKLAHMGRQGPAIVAVGGLGLGWRSCLSYGVVLGAAIMISSMISGIYGVSMAAIGMLSFITTAIAIDTYGPISDNAGGIAEMSGLGPKVRAITDSLDSLGNTTAAIGKGLNIGSGVLCALSMMVAFAEDAAVSIVITNPLVIVGCFIGSSVMFWLSGVMMGAVDIGAAAVVNEVRRQYPMIMKGGKPDSNTCIRLCTQTALKLMRKPVVVALATPVICGLIGGPVMVGGVLAGVIFVASVQALSTANAGGAWDNAKKFVKAEREGVFGDLDDSEYELAHAAVVVGDTIGDPCKDVVAPNQDIMMKLMATISVIMIPVFSSFNLISFITNLLG